MEKPRTARLLHQLFYISA